MCGIVGFRTTRNFIAFKENLPRAVNSISHRGPDDSGLFFDREAGVGLGHRRLSVIDLSPHGRQPMESDDGKVQIVYNGEVYNFREIRKRLLEYGHCFNGNSDTEVILKAYMQWGIECIKKFIGMFALALWDGRSRQLFLVRDRMGIKPLYYHHSSGNLFFASELKAIMAFRSFAKEIDPEALNLFFHYGYVPAPRTIFKDTFKLHPGRFAIYDGQNLHIQSFWKLPIRDNTSNNNTPNDNDAIDELDHLLTESVSDRLVSDVPLGALLSGGIDSSLVVALMQKNNTSPVRTFSIGFRETDYNEAPFAGSVAEHLGTDHTELYVTPKEAIGTISKLPEIYDEPFADPSAIPTFLVSRLARSQVTVALSGDGGDEQFAGYMRYFETQTNSRKFQRVPKPVKAILAEILERMPYHWVERYKFPWRRFLPRRFWLGNFSDKCQRMIKKICETELKEFYRMAISIWSVEELQSLLGREVPKCQFEDIFLKTENLGTLSRLMLVDQRTYLPDDILTKVDRASMAVSLEVRVPLLDHRVVEFTSKLQDRLIYRNGSTKYLLKKLLSRYVPAELFERPKMGFGVPIGQWFKDELKAPLLDYLSPDRLKKAGLYDHCIIDKKLREHFSGQADHQYRLWSLLQFEMWRERWLDR